ncbi:MAG TPA: winged helix-turn-helix domain-containing protein [Ktedonobacteraceae bacterium]|nr:winged helix-turn-helix domain-containing protein [Ktedonobacteraceae bacterium]
MGLAARDKWKKQTTIDWSASQEGSGTCSEHLTVNDQRSFLADVAEEHAVLAGIATNLRSGFILLNSAEHLTYVNPSAQRLLHIESEALSTPSVFDVRKQLVGMAAHPGNAQVELNRLWEHPEAENFTDVALTDAAIRWLRVQSFPIHDNPGRLLGRGVLLDDITLERSATTTRNETLAMAVHELKTPLAIIKGSATTLLSSSIRLDPAMQREMLQMIDTQTDRLHEILNTLLDVWRLDAGAQNLHFSQVHLPQLLNLLVERWRKNAPDHSIVCKITGEIPPVLCDPARLEQAFHHLLHNAVTYSPDGGTIRLLLESDESELRLSISDQGRGIVPEHLEHIFDRFYRVGEGDEQATGSGLGLAVVRATIEAHGGRIWADSPGPGAGSIFYCTWPFTPPNVYAGLSAGRAASASSSSQDLIQSAHSPRSSQRVSITVIESDPRMARYLRANLEEQHYRVQVLAHGTQFLRQIDLEEPDVVLLATRLTDMQGIELLQRLREFSQVPVLMLCADDDEDERVHLLDLGADDLVSKPFGMKELLARLRVLLRRQVVQDKSEPAAAIFTSGDLVLDYAQHQVLMKGRPVQLSRTEYKLLSTLAQNAGRVLTHELLLERVWGSEYNREVDFIWVYISRLRRKIEPDSRHPRYIVTVPDVGYKLVKF